MGALPRPSFLPVPRIQWHWNSLVGGQEEELRQRCRSCRVRRATIAPVITEACAFCHDAHRIGCFDARKASSALQSAQLEGLNGAASFRQGVACRCCTRPCRSCLFLSFPLSSVFLRCRRRRLSLPLSSASLIPGKTWCELYCQLGAVSRLFSCTFSSGPFCLLL